MRCVGKEMELRVCLNWKQEVIAGGPDLIVSHSFKSFRNEKGREEALLLAAPQKCRVVLLHKTQQMGFCCLRLIIVTS